MEKQMYDIRYTTHEICDTLIFIVVNKPSSNRYFEELFKVHNVNWEQIYCTPRRSTYNTYKHSFQYNILNNVLFLNKKLYLSGITNSPLCSLNQPMKQLSVDQLMKQLYFKNATQSNRYKTSWINHEFTLDKNRFVKNHILLISKVFIYNSHEEICLILIPWIYRTLKK